MKLKTETGEELVLDEAGKHYVSESAESDTSIEVSDVDELLESGKIEIVAEETDDVIEAAGAAEPKAKPLKKKKIKADGSGEVEVYEDEDEDDEDDDDDDAEDEDDDKKKNPFDKKEAKESVELDFDVQEDIDALFDGQELTEDFKARTTLVFETAVKAKVKENLATIEAKMEAELTEQTDSILEDVTAKLDGYLDYMVNEWVEENKLAVENGLKNEILEGFVDGMKKLFTENYVDVPEDKLNVVDEQADEIASLKEELDVLLNKNIDANTSLDKATAKEIFSTVSEDLTMTQVEKLKTLAEGVVYEDQETYTEKLETLKGTYFPSEAKKDEVIAEEKSLGKTDDGEMTDSMRKVVDSLSQSSNTSIFGA
jgi:hypothetical protein